MNKADFIAKVSQLKPNYGYSDRDSYTKERGYEDCKNAILELAAELDEGGLTAAGYQLFRQQTNDLTMAYNELFQTQHALFDANKQIQSLTHENQEMQKSMENLLQKLNKEE